MVLVFTPKDAIIVMIVQTGTSIQLILRVGQTIKPELDFVAK
jgi:hypothetical protein